MFKPFFTGAVIALSALALAPGSAMAGEQPNTLIMGKDADTDTVPRHSRIFNRVLRAMKSELQAIGFRVYDETCSEQARLNRNLRLMTEHMGIEARVGMVGNRFEIDKIRRPQER